MRRLMYLDTIVDLAKRALLIMHLEHLHNHPSVGADYTLFDIHTTIIVTTITISFWLEFLEAQGSARALMGCCGGRERPRDAPYGILWGEPIPPPPERPPPDPVLPGQLQPWEVGLPPRRPIPPAIRYMFEEVPRPRNPVPVPDLMPPDEFSTDTEALDSNIEASDSRTATLESGPTDTLQSGHTDSNTITGHTGNTNTSTLGSGQTDTLQSGTTGGSLSL